MNEPTQIGRDEADEIAIAVVVFFIVLWAIVKAVIWLFNF